MKRIIFWMGLAAAVFAAALSVPAGAGSGAPEPAAWSDDLDDFDQSRWSKADGWSNGNPFDVGWRSDHVTFAGGQMTLTLDDQTCPSGCSGEPYASGEYRTNESYGFGQFEVSMRAAAGDGIVSSFFLYTGPFETPPTPWDEIDIEILGKDPTKVQLNYVTDGVGGHETTIDLGFDASLDFHTYAFEWSPDRIVWFVDGFEVHSEDGSRGPLPTTPGKVMMNLWTGAQVSGWLGHFTYSGPVQVSYESVSYVPSVEVGGSLHVEANEITVRQQGKRYRAAAAVLIVDEQGNAVSGARVEGAWSGGRRVRMLSATTGANGWATFDSPNSTSSGPYEFCVSGVSLDGWVYDPSMNTATCSAASLQ